MKTALGWLGLFAMGACLFAGTAGCETACTEDERTNGTTCTAKSLTRFEGTEFSKSATYTAGNDITLIGVFGEIIVDAGTTADTVEVTYIPFSYRAHDAEAEAKEDMEVNLKTDVVADAAGAVTVTSSRDGGGSSLGATMIVKLPTSFNGKLIVDNNGNGDVSNNDDFDVDVNAVASAIALDVRTGSDLGECRIQGAPSVTTSSAHCGSFVQLLDVSDNVTIVTTFGANTDDAVNLRLAGVSATATGGSIQTEDGTVAVDFPMAGNFTIDASTGQGSISVTPNAACTVEGDPLVKQSISCGTGGPVYTINAGLDSLGDSNVNVNFL